MNTHDGRMAREGLEVTSRRYERRPMPRNGDVLVARRSARADVYMLSIFPGDAHTRQSRYSEAIEKAREVARERRVDAWFTGDHTHYAHVAHFRENPSHRTLEPGPG